MTENVSKFFQKTGRGTGNILQDFISSKVTLTKLKSSIPFPVLAFSGLSPKKDELCDICGSGSEPTQPLTLQEIEILKELITSSPLASRVTSQCPSCCRTLEKLTKLKKKIELITQCLRALIRIQLRKQKEIQVVPESGNRGIEKDTDNVEERQNFTQASLSSKIPLELELTDNESEDGRTTHEDSGKLDVITEDTKCVTLGNKQEENECGEEIRLDEDLEYEELRPSSANQNEPTEPELTDTEEERAYLESQTRSDKAISNQSNTESRLTDTPNARITCATCCLDYASEYSLNRHYNSILHQEGMRSSKVLTNNEISFCCYICSKQFFMLRDLVSHLKSDHKTSSRVINQNRTEADETEMKPIVCEMEIDLSDEEENEPLTNQIIENPSLETNTSTLHIEPLCDEKNMMEKPVTRTKRKSAFRAANLLRSLLKTETSHEKDENYSDASVVEDNSDSESSHENGSDTKETEYVHKIGIKKQLKSKRCKAPPPENPLECEVCGYKALDLEDSTLHKSQHPDKKCDVCVITFLSDTTYKNHLASGLHKLGRETQKTGKEGDIATFVCRECDKYSTGSLSQMYKHKKYTHGGPFICKKCGAKLSSHQTLKYHMTHVHSGILKKIPGPKNRFIPPQDKRFPCKICGKRFADAPGMYKHVKAVHKKIRAQCDSCPKNFSLTAALNLHKKKAHGDGSSKTKKYKQPRVTCDICQRSLVGRMNMNRHIELIHFPNKRNCQYGCPDEIGNDAKWMTHLEQCKSEKLTESSKCYCHYCGNLFSTQLLRIAHHLRVHESFPCQHCNRSFTQNRFRDLHIDADHKTAKPFLCPKCGKGFRQQLNLTFHSTTVCGDDEDAKNELLKKRRELHQKYRRKSKPHKCSKCSKAFVDERRLEDHKRNVHLNQNSSEEEDDE